MKRIRNYFQQIAKRISFRLRKQAFEILQRVSFVSGGKKLLVVRLDAIGDYILFRNALYELKRSERFGGYKITMLGNRLWKDLAENLDKNVVHEFIWIDPKILLKREGYPFDQFLFLLKLKIKGFSIVLNPVHSRILDIDIFLSTIKAPLLIGSSGDETNFKKGEKSIADKLYTELIPVPDYSTFEFYRNAHFISKLAGIQTNEFKLKIDLNPSPDSNFKIIIAPGAGHISRRWPIERFSEVIQQLSIMYPSAFFYICGAVTDKEQCEFILTLTKQANVLNMCGNLSLMQFAELVNQSSLVIANESSSIHLAAALNKPAICISNGNMFGRFNPYPSELRNNIQTIYSSESFLISGHFKTNVEKNRIRSNEDISEIPTEKVVDAAVKSLQQKGTN